MSAILYTLAQLDEALDRSLGGIDNGDWGDVDVVNIRADAARAVNTDPRDAYPWTLTPESPAETVEHFLSLASLSKVVKLTIHSGDDVYVATVEVLPERVSFEPDVLDQLPPAVIDLIRRIMATCLK